NQHVDGGNPFLPTGVVVPNLRPALGLEAGQEFLRASPEVLAARDVARQGVEELFPARHGRGRILPADEQPLELGDARLELGLIVAPTERSHPELLLQLAFGPSPCFVLEIPE